MARPYQEINVFSIQDRRDQATARKPWLVRWAVDGRQRSKAFRTQAEADRYRARILLAAEHGDVFDPATGEPESWTPARQAPTVFEWASRWLREQWPEWQPRTRRSAAEALARFVLLAVHPDATAPPNGCRLVLQRALVPGGAVDAPASPLQWIERWSLPIDQLDRAFLAEVDRELGTGDRGQPLAAETAARFRKNARTCLRRAVQLGLLSTDPWPPSPRGRSKRKATRLRRKIDGRRLPDPATMARIIEEIATHQPGSRIYQVMTAVSYYGGLRPSEVVMLRRHTLDLPTQGWGRVEVIEADIDVDEPGEPKTGPRSVPIPPVLVQLLGRWVDEHDFAPDDLIFRTRKGTMPTRSNWGRAWHRALERVGVAPLRVYDCRHAAGTTWLKAGVPLGEVASRLGHSVETLVSTYVGALKGDEAVANARIDAVLAEAEPRSEPTRIAV